MAVGGALGASAGIKGRTGTAAMILGGVAGAIAGYGLSDEYTHVGSGLILFPAKNTSYNLDNGAGTENTGDKSYIVVPPGADVLRNRNKYDSDQSISYNSRNTKIFR